MSGLRCEVTGTSSEAQARGVSPSRLRPDDAGNRSEVVIFPMFGEFLQLFTSSLRFGRLKLWLRSCASLKARLFAVLHAWTSPMPSEGGIRAFTCVSRSTRGVAVESLHPAKIQSRHRENARLRNASAPLIPRGRQRCRARVGSERPHLCAEAFAGLRSQACTLSRFGIEIARMPDVETQVPPQTKERRIAHLGEIVGHPRR